MKGFLIFLVFVLGVGGLLAAVPAYRQKVVQSLSYNACDTPLPYNVGNIDPKFHLNTAQVLQDITLATALWNTARGKPLFSYTPKASLQVNFVYDERTALNNTITNLQSSLSQKDTSLQEQVANYRAQVAAFKQKLAAFNAEVEKYNQAGGAPEDVYKSLQEEQSQLQAEGNALNNLARQLSLSTNAYNSNVFVLNGDITQLQNDLLQKPEEGLYNPQQNTITIYFTSNQNELIHTLAHEFGHALGMQHVTNQQAIMYAQASRTLVVMPEDMAQLTYVCRDQSAVVHDFHVFALWIFDTLQNLRQQVVK